MFGLLALRLYCNVQCVYKVYNEGKGRSYEPITWEGVKEEANKFRMEQIYPHIAAIEKERRVYVALVPLSNQVPPLTGFARFAVWTAKQSVFVQDFVQFLDDWENKREEKPIEWKSKQKAIAKEAGLDDEEEEAIVGSSLED